MSDIKLLIEIPEEEYNIIKKSNAPKTWAEHLIAKGTPLPKGHGRLGDLDVLREEVYSWGMNDYEPSDFIDEIDGADTIIEADKAESDETDE